jgi:hypothetical protein
VYSFSRTSKQLYLSGFRVLSTPSVLPTPSGRALYPYTYLCQKSRRQTHGTDTLRALGLVQPARMPTMLNLRLEIIV